MLMKLKVIQLYANIFYAFSYTTNADVCPSKVETVYEKQNTMSWVGGDVS